MRAFLVLAAATAGCVDSGALTADSHAPDLVFLFPCVDERDCNAGEACTLGWCVRPPLADLALELDESAPVDLKVEIDASPIPDLERQIDQSRPPDQAELPDLATPPDLLEPCELIPSSDPTLCYDTDGGAHAACLRCAGVKKQGACAPFDDPTKISCGKDNCGGCPKSWTFYAPDKNGKCY